MSLKWPKITFYKNDPKRGIQASNLYDIKCRFQLFYGTNYLLEIRMGNKYKYNLDRLIIGLMINLEQSNFDLNLISKARNNQRTIEIHDIK